MFQILSRLIITAAGFIYPCYASFKAIKGNDLQTLETWLMYWIVMGAVLALENTVEWIFAWFPFYYEVKTLVILWLTLPQIQGSSYIYLAHIEPFLSLHEAEIDRAVADARVRAKQVGLDYLNRGVQRVRQMILGGATRLNAESVDGAQPYSVINQPPSLADPASTAASHFYSMAEGILGKYAPAAAAAGALLLQPMKGRAPSVRHSNVVSNPAAAGSMSSAATTTVVGTNETRSRSLRARASRRAQLEAELADLDSVSSVSSPASYPTSSSSSNSATNSPHHTVAGNGNGNGGGGRVPRSVSTGQVPSFGSMSTARSDEPSRLLPSYSNQYLSQSQQQSQHSSRSEGFEQIRREELGDYDGGQGQQGRRVTIGGSASGNDGMRSSSGIGESATKKGWWGWNAAGGDGGGNAAAGGDRQSQRSTSENDVRRKKDT